jgi:hypothetical protein
MAKVSKIKQSETIIVKRSTINFAPYNPKNHSEEAIRQQRKNFKSVGFLGGITINTLTRNLISGHKRVMAFDLEYKYDGTKETDYDLKVEAIELTLQQEKEQNIYMDARATNTKQDIELLALILPELTIENTGLEDYDIQLIESQVPDFHLGDNEPIKTDLQDLKKDDQANKAAVKELKKSLHKANKENQTPSYFTVTFKDYDSKAEFLEQIGINGDEVFIKSDNFINLVNEFYKA